MTQNGLDELAERPTEDERKRATKAQSPFTRLVLGRYEVVDGVLRLIEGSLLDEHERRYFPAGATGLLKETYHLNVYDEASLVTFAQRWGLLGYADIVKQAESKSVPGDPLIWIWAHVTGIRTALELYRRLRRGNKDGVEEYMETLRRPLGRDQLAAHGRAAWLFHQDRSSEAYALLPALEGPGSEQPNPQRIELFLTYGQRQRITHGGVGGGSALDNTNLAWQAILQIINPNLPGSYQQLHRPFDAEPLEAPQKGLAFDSTLSAVYWQLAELVSASKVRQCKDEQCGFPFVQQHGHQRFCPVTDVEREQGKHESRCAMRWRKRQQRQRRGES